MRIIFVRHGHPDYKKDCLTELGHTHAEAAAERLAEEKPTAIYASTCGRAYETAEHIAAYHDDMPIVKCEFMREIKWGSTTDEPIPRNGNPWFVADDKVAAGQSVRNSDWETEEPYSQSKVVSSNKTVSEGFDELLSTLGYRREGDYYRVERENPDTVFMVSHGGSSSAVLSHLLNLPFPQVCATVRPDFTAIHILKLSGAVGSLITPQIELLNDARHIQAKDEATFDN